MIETVVCGLLVSGTLARGEDIGTRRLLIKDVDPSKRLVQVFSRDPDVQYAAAGDPGANGAAVHFYSTTDAFCAVLEPGANWRNSGTAWKYSNPVTKTRALIRDGKLKVKIKSGVTYTLADDGSQSTVNAQVQFGTGTRYCMRCPGTVKNDSSKYLGKDCVIASPCDPEPAPCEPPSTTSTTATTTTTSTSLPSVCGNGVIEGIEECDDSNTDPNDGCDVACQLESVDPAVCAGVPSVGGTNLGAAQIASGLVAPVHVAAPRLDPSRVFVVEQPGRIQVVKNGVQLGTPFLAIEGIVRDSGSEEGLLSVAFDPDYENNRFFYVYYVDNTGNLAISRFEANPGNPDDALEASEHIITTISHPIFGNHNGGNLNFGPDGFLYAATGDGGSGGDPSDNAQNDASLLGKLLRIDVATDTVTTWGKGLRNPFRFSFDRANGDLYIGDVGQGSWEEINYVAGPVPAGTNFGWDDMEGRHCFEPGSGCLTAGRTLPVLEYCNTNCVSGACTPAACGAFQTDRGQAVIGGFVYRGCALPDLHGEYFYSDTFNDWIHTFKGVSGGDAQNVVDRSAQLGSHTVTSFGEDTRGELYFTDYGAGAVFKIVPN